MDTSITAHKFQTYEHERAFKNIQVLLSDDYSLEDAAEKIIEGTFMGMDIERKDSLDRLIDYIVFKARTGVPHIANMAYPSMRIENHKMEEKVKLLLNEHLMPEIVIKILKFFTRNIQNSDTNLHLAELVTNELIINAIFETFKTFRMDVAITDREKKTLNVKRIQQFSAHTDSRFSSPLDAACRLKYVLEFIAIRQDVSAIYSKEDIRMAVGEMQ
ncbi:MAG: hypothetical protein PF637_11045 [Spirochaetes bacterium]|jgi:hypothetical protein|nr:hypothetical protein [Spirochaetota bacterium]